MAGARPLVAACYCWWWLAFAAATELDLLGALSLHNTTRAGVTAAPGMQPQRLAYQLTGDNRMLQIEGAAFDRAKELIRRSPEFSILATLKQEPANSGTIISFSHGYNRYLEVQSSGRRDELRLHVSTAAGTGGAAAEGGGARVETFPLRLADGAWHRLAVSVSGAQAALLLDCHVLYRRLIAPPDRNFSAPQLSLWLGQRNSKHSLFKGTIQDVRLVSGPHGYLAQCPGLDTECPTCGQFALLQATVQELTAHIQDLALKLAGTEARLARLEQCDCQKSCYSNGSVHADGATWQRACHRCSCVHGEITCRPVECERAECKNPVLHPGECCPTCLRQCLLKGTLYEHGDRFAPKECAECVCHDGNMQCTRVDPDTACPPLPCDPPDQFTVPGECCKFCPGVDYCSMGHSCDENATCMNLNTKYTCKCNQGFQGDGSTCEDVDECQEQGGLYGHHCHSNTRCVNVVGSYVCQCLPGYARRDKFNCVEVDECASETHSCHAQATCSNTPGSYTCQCQEGYSGDGYDCQPICTGGCLNGGSCVGPETCSCALGFEGARCERDVDECSPPAPPAHPAVAPPCPPRASCVNTPGGYYCVCREGYTQDQHCHDVDECAAGLHTCHASARCVNLDGAFRCECVAEPCDLSCSWRGTTRAHGARWSEAGGCVRCACVAGVASCRRARCACDHAHNATQALAGGVDAGDMEEAAETAPAACCAHCDARYHCRHQEMHHVSFRSGERWLYQCQICECLLGEIDCWEPECADDAEDAGDGGCCAGDGVLRLERAGCAPHHCSACPGGQCAATLVSNLACCVHRRAGGGAAAAALLALWWARPASSHRKHRGARRSSRPEPRAPA